MQPTERVTLRLPARELEGIDVLVTLGEFSNRSEAIRAALRSFVKTKLAEVHGQQEILAKVEELKKVAQQQNDLYRK